MLKAASITKGGSCLSVLDADDRRRMLNSNSFGTVSSDIRKSIADFIKKLCSKRSNIYEYLIIIYLFTYLKLLKWNLKQHMQRLLGPSKVSLHIFFEQS